MRVGKEGFLKKAGALCLSFALVAGAFGVAAPDEAEAHHRTYKTSSIVVDAHTGEIYSASKADARRYPASLTKIMTMVVTFDAIKAGKINLETELKVPRAATKVERSKLGLKEGQHIRVKKAISALIVKSANDVAVTLAWNIARNEKGFVKLMNAKARQIGLEHTHFANASGLFDPRQVTTARDMAKLAKHLINEYPGFYEYFSRQNFEFDGITYDTHNHLMQRYEGMDGIKTGYIQASGHNLVSSAQRDGTRLVGVIFGGHSAAERDAEMAEKLDAAFSVATGKTNNPHNSQDPIPPLANRENSRVFAALPVRMP